MPRKVRIVAAIRSRDRILIGWSEVATPFGVEQDIVTRQGRYPDTVEVRSVLCYFSAREPCINTLELSKRLGIFITHSKPISKTGRKGREKKGTYGDGMIYVNIPIPVP